MKEWSVKKKEKRVSEFSYVHARWRLWRFSVPIITVFGGTHAEHDSFFYQQALACGKLLAQNNVAVVSGGGPGIMEAILCGAAAQGSTNRVLGIGVEKIDETFKSACGYNTIFVPSFAARKKLLIHYSSGFIIFPGGIGTLDECAETLNMMKIGLVKRSPVVLVGSAYWSSMLEWFAVGCKEKFIRSDLCNILMVTDDIGQAVQKVTQIKPNV